MNLILTLIFLIPSAGLSTDEIRSLQSDIRDFKSFLQYEHIEEVYTSFMEKEILRNLDRYLRHINDKRYYNRGAFEISKFVSKWGEIIREKYGDAIVDSMVINLSERKCYLYNTREFYNMNNWGYEDRLILATNVAIGNEAFGRGTIKGSFIIGRKAAEPTLHWENRGISIPYGHPFNAFGARKLELWRDGKYTHYACHGTDDVNCIGKSISLGCIRFTNVDILIIYELIRENKTKVVIVE